MTKKQSKTIQLSTPQKKAVDKEVDKQVNKQLKKELKKEEEKLEKGIEKRIEEKFHKRLIKATANQTKQKTQYLHNQFRDHASTAIIAAFGFLIALVWRDLIVKLTKTAAIPFLEQYPFLAELYTALIITIIAIIAISLVGKWAQKPGEK